jgi:hypothetical protein
MPKPKVKSAKSGDDDSKKSKNKKNTTLEEVETSETSKEEPTNNTTGISSETVVNSVVDTAKEPQAVSEEIIEIKYEEPVLTNLIVER